MVITRVSTPPFAKGGVHPSFRERRGPKPSCTLMYFVYILRTENKTNVFYIGMTGDIDRRLDEHLRGKVYTTMRLKNPQLVYYEAYLDRDFASEREKQLKRFGSAYVALMKRLGYK